MPGIGLPTRLAAMGVERSQFDDIIKGAMADHCPKPIRASPPGEYRDMLEQSL